MEASTQANALPVRGERREVGGSVAQLADGLSLGVLLVAVVAIPVTFSIANPDVFAMPKTIVAVGLAVLLLVLLGIHWIAVGARLRDLRASWLAWAIVAFVAWNLVAIVFAVDPGHALVGERLQYQGLGTTLAYVVYLLAARSTLRTPWRRAAFLVAAVTGATAVTGYAVAQAAALDPIWTNWDAGDRVFSTIGQANALGAYLVIALPLTIVLARSRSMPVQLGLATLAVLHLAALAFTLSRGGYVGVAVAAMVLAAILWLRRGALISRRGLAVTAGTVLVVGLAGAIGWGDRIVATIERAQVVADPNESSAQMRLDMWAVGAAIALDNPIVGRGQDSYVLVFHDYREATLAPDRSDLLGTRRPESPHNHYLAIAGGAGLPALAAYLAIIGVASTRAIRGMRTSSAPRTWLLGGALLAAIAGHLVTDAFMTAETAGSVLFWVVLGAAAALGPPTVTRPASGS
jgi:O-antigen ligase